MNKKGFTLIELLAVILVLGIIALIAIPVVNKVIDQAKKGAFERTVENIVKAVEEECQKDMLLGNTTAKTYTFTDGVATPTINVKGKLPKSGTISVNNSCESIVNVTDGKYRATKSLASGDIIIEKKVERLTYDANGNKEADIGDIITVKSTENTNEEFYVISNDGTNVVALAKYNLKVGKVYTSASVSTEIDTNEEGYGLQDEEMKGAKWSGYPYKGTTSFSSSSSSYEGSIVKQYVDAYKNKLPSEVIEARLITKAEIEQLVNNGNSLSDEIIKQKASDAQVPWIYSTSYWTGTAYSNANYVWCVNADSGSFYGRRYSGAGSDMTGGARQVITILESEL